MFPRPAILLPPILALAAGCAAERTPSAAVPGGTVAQARPLAVYRHGPDAPTAPERTRAGRYSFLSNGADAAQVDPLLAVIDVSLPQTLSSVGDAAEYLLGRTGYCLMEPEGIEVRHLLRLPLPQVHRHLGPMTLRDALLALGGRAYALAVDETYREVGYRILPAGGPL